MSNRGIIIRLKVLIKQTRKTLFLLEQELQSIIEAEEKKIMRKAKQHLLMSLAIFAVAFVAVIVFIAASANGAVQTLSEAVKEAEAPQIVPVQSKSPEIPESSKIQPPESVSDAPEAVQTYQQPIVTPKPEQEQQKQPQLERIPFTSKPVTAGEPESYIGTYGQCPFYENAMEGKGCVPPPDIECNEDWSKCEYKGEK